MRVFARASPLWICARKRRTDTKFGGLAFFLSILVAHEVVCSFTLSSNPPERYPSVVLAMRGSVYIATSLDGYIATPDGSTSFLDELPPPEDGNDIGFADFLASVDVIIMGRNTFEKVLSFGKDVWPYGETKMVVWSRGEVEIPEYRKATVSSSSLPPTSLFEKLQTQGCKRAYIDGGTTVQKFLEAGLVTDMTLSTAPVLLGDGIPLFGRGDTMRLKHLETTSQSNGIVTSRYDVLRPTT